MTNYPLTQSLLGVEELAVNEEGTFINAALLETCEANLQTADEAKAEAAQKLADAEKALADAQAHAKEVEEQLATAQADKETAEKALSDAETAHAETINALKAEFGEKEATLNTRISELEAGAEAHSAEMEQIKGALATAEQTIADKDAQIAELSNDAGDEPEQGAAPQNNGEGAQVPEMKSGIPQFDPANPVESKAAIDAYLAQVRKG